MASPNCALFPQDETCTTCLSRGQSIGLTLATVTGVISTLAVLTVFFVVIKNVVLFRRHVPSAEWRLFKSPLDVYMSSLLMSDLLQGIGKVLHVKWLSEGLVQCSGYCTAQGMIQQIGETGVAQATLAIAVHTFIIIFFREGAKALKASVAVVAAIWLFVLIFPIAGVATLRDGDNRYITPTPYWCWVSKEHAGAQFGGEYGWIWLSAAVSVALYIPLYLQLGGYIQTTWIGKQWWQFRIMRPERSKEGGKLSSSTPSREAYVMLLYPISYFFLVLPDSIVRWMEFTNKNMPSSAIFFATSVFGLSGLVNVALLYYARPGLLLLNGLPSKNVAEERWQQHTNLSLVSEEGADPPRLRTFHPTLGSDEEI